MSGDSFLDWEKGQKPTKTKRLFPYAQYYNGGKVVLNRRVLDRSAITNVDSFTDVRPLNFLKFYMIISYSFCKKNKITKNVFELLLYIYSEPPLTLRELRGFLALLPNKKFNLSYFLENNLITETEPLKEYLDAPVKFYRLSYQTIKAIDRFYLKLTKTLNSVERYDHNVVFRKNPMTLLDKKYKEAIIKMNEDNSDNFNNFKTKS